MFSIDKSDIKRMTIKGMSLIFDEKRILGQGRFATVFCGIHLMSESYRYYGCMTTLSWDHPVAVKRLQKITRVDESANFLQEVELMQKAGDHPNILRYILTEENKDFLFIATELCNGTLEDYYVEGKYQGPRFQNEKEMLRQMTQGLAHLHNLDIVHRDIKPTNILIFITSFELKSHIKLADFGISKTLKMGRNDFTNTSLTNPIGTRGWMPPELFKEERFDFNVDVWALGCTFGYTLSGGKHPFGDDLITCLDRIRKEESMLLVQEDLIEPYSVDSEAVDLIRSMLSVQPRNRPSVSEVLKNSFLKNEDPTAEFLGVCKMFQYSTTTDNIGQFKELVKNDGVDVNATTITQYGEEMSPLHLVCRYYQEDNLGELLKDLLLHGADVNSKANEVKMTKYRKIFSGLTPLHLLFGCCVDICNSMIDLIQLLVDYGADVNAKDEDGYSPLHYLCFYYHKDDLIDILQFLLENDADINAKDKDGWTPLHYLCSSYNNDNLMEIVQLALENGADANAKDKNGEAPLHFLCKFSDLECQPDLKNIVQLLIQKDGAQQVNDKDKNGDTPLHHLCTYNYSSDILMDFVSFFVENGANIEVKNNSGSTLSAYLRERCLSTTKSIPSRPIGRFWH